VERKYQRILIIELRLQLSYKSGLIRSIIPVVTAPVHFETSINLHKFIGWIRHQSTSRRQSKNPTVTVRSSIGEEDFLKLLILS